MNTIICGDSIKKIKDIPDNSIHLIASDIPYGIGAEDWDVLHDNTNSAYLGTSPAQEKAGAIFKKRGKPLNGWSEADKKIPLEYYEWCKKWAPDWYRVLKPGSSVFIFAGRRLAHRCICALEDSGFIFKDMIAWEKETAAHRAQRASSVFERRKDTDNAAKWNGWKLGNLKPIFEPILWFTKPYKIGGTITDNLILNEVGAYNESAIKYFLGHASNMIKVKSVSGDKGCHPTQKPINLMKILISLTTLENHVVLDPFCGSGTTLVAAKELKRNYIGIERKKEYCDISETRLSSVKHQLNIFEL